MKTDKRTKWKKYKSIQGFTLAELLIVVAIIAVLVAVSVPVFMSKKKNTEKTVCEYNRKTLVREIMLDRMEDDDFDQAEAEAVLEKSDAYCPAGGTYEAELDELYIKVTCSIHGSSMGGIDDDSSKIVSAFIDEYKDFVVQNSKKDNDTIRKEFLAKYDGKWPTLTVGSNSWSIEPYYQGKYSSKPTEECVWLFARDSSLLGKNNWNASYVYNTVDGKWYGATKWDGTEGGTRSIAYDDTAFLDYALKNEKRDNGTPMWVEISDYKVSK